MSILCLTDSNGNSQIGMSALRSAIIVLQTFAAGETYIISARASAIRSASHHKC
ncbi:MAG: hypothetical protein WKF71_12990 [Pyrinomonadaceae bacterium]